MNPNRSIWLPRANVIGCCNILRRSRRAGPRALERRQNATRPWLTFAAGRPDILVATTVIEWASTCLATVMVIEHAERFGLSQLHQLAVASDAVPESRAACCSIRCRLAIPPGAARHHARNRGRVPNCREDLRAGVERFPGTGKAACRISDWRTSPPMPILSIARDDARLALEKDPDPIQERGKALKILLYLFERDAVVKTVRSG